MAKAMNIPTVLAVCIVIVAILTGLAALGMVEGNWILQGWSRTDRLQAAQTFVTYVGFLVATAAVLLAAHEFRASVQKPDLIVEWRSPLLAQDRNWTSDKAVVPALQNSQAVIEVRVMNYGKRAATSPLVEFLAQGDDLSLKQFTLAQRDFVRPLREEQWREDLQFGTRGTHVGHFRPSSLIYPRTVEPYAFELHLGPAREMVSETADDGTVTTIWQLAFPAERTIDVRVMSAEQTVREQVIRLDLDEARRLYED
ncbi:MAG: hypothetical protein CVU47_02500 [Chloroflexi bacterium HGW-Chloroflexi-9]|nr:MAG: hypothetical protein CVU47_02500 [Chloroflexi bacterium HGW-Chloroflexi-9]